MLPYLSNGQKGFTLVDFFFFPQAFRVRRKGLTRFWAVLRFTPPFTSLLEVFWFSQMELEFICAVVPPVCCFLGESFHFVPLLGAAVSFPLWVHFQILALLDLL